MSNKRKPMVSDEDLRHIDAGRLRVGANLFGREDMRDFYEACITRGELRVVKEVTLSGENLDCSGCGRWCGEDPTYRGLNQDAGYTYCPACGNKIKR